MSHNNPRIVKGFHGDGSRYTRVRDFFYFNLWLIHQDKAARRTFIYFFSQPPRQLCPLQQ